MSTSIKKFDCDRKETKPVILFCGQGQDTSFMVPERVNPNLEFQDPIQLGWRRLQSIPQVWINR